MQPVLAPHPACASSPRIHPCFFFRGSTLSSQLACHPAGRSLCRWNFAHVVRHADQKKQAVHQHHSHIITSHASFCSSHSLSPPQPAGTKRYPGGKVPDVLGNLCLSTHLGGTWSGKSDRCPAMPASPSGACWSWAICKASPSANGLG